MSPQETDINMLTPKNCLLNRIFIKSLTIAELEWELLGSCKVSGKNKTKDIITKKIDINRTM